MRQPLPAYSGDDPYVFVCYAHEDRIRVYPEIRRLQDGDLNIWYDEGISPGEEWDEELGRAIDGAEKLLFFVSQRSVASRHCRNEIHFAQNHNIPILAVHLEATELPQGLELSIGLSQAIVKHELTERNYQERLDRALVRKARYSKNPTSLTNSSQAERAPHRRLRFPLILAAAILVLGMIWISWRLPQQSSPEGPHTGLARRAVAVLPFENLSPDPEHQYFAAGLHGEVINQLSKAHDLSVIARGSVLTYSESDRTPREIASELNVSALVEGTVRYAENRVRITAQVVGAESMEALWSDTFEYEFADLFTIESNMAASIAGALSLSQIKPDPEVFEAPRTSNPDA